MSKVGFPKSWCGAACCFAVVLVLSGCSSTAQGNRPSGISSEGNTTADNQQYVGQETENQQSVMEQETGNPQSVGQDIGKQPSVTGQESGNQQSENPDLGYHQNDEPGVHHINEEPVAGHHSSGNLAGQAQGEQNPAAGQDGISGGVSSGNNGIDLETAKSIALQSAGVDAANAAFVKTKLDYDDGVAEYEIEFVAGSTKYEYEINAANGTILESSQKAVEQNSGGVSTQAAISVEEAKSIALNYAQFTEDQVVYTKTKLDYDDGKAEYEIEFYAGEKEYSFTIDAVTGSVLEMEME